MGLYILHCTCKLPNQMRCKSHAGSRSSILQSAVPMGRSGQNFACLQTPAYRKSRLSRLVWRSLSIIVGTARGRCSEALSLRHICDFVGGPAHNEVFITHSMNTATMCTSFSIRHLDCHTYERRLAEATSKQVCIKHISQCCTVALRHGDPNVMYDN